MHQHRATWPIGRMCQVLQVSRSGYYAWQKRPLSRREQEEGSLRQPIERIYTTAFRIDGSGRVQATLVAEGKGYSRYRVARLMRQLGLAGGRLRRRPRTTTPFNTNVLNRTFQAERANTKGVADITYIPTEEGYLYLAAMLDLYSRKVVAWAMDNHWRETLVETALRMALDQRCPLPGLLPPSDRGSQYASHGYWLMLKDASIQISVSRVGNCLDKAAMERFFSSLKVEWVYQHHYRTRTAAKSRVFYSIEGFYNPHRLLSSLDYLSPHQFEMSLTS